MISSNYIATLKRMNPKRIVTVGSKADGTHPVPLDFSIICEDLDDLIEDNARFLFICSLDVLGQIMDIYEAIGRFLQPDVVLIDDKEYLALKIWYPKRMLIVLTEGEKLRREYWLLKIKKGFFDDVIDLERVEGRPVHRIGVTADY